MDASARDEFAGCGGNAQAFGQRRQLTTGEVQPKAHAIPASSLPWDLAADA